MEDPILDNQTRQDFPDNFNRPKKGLWEWIASHNFLLITVILLFVLLLVAGLWFFRTQRSDVPEQPNVVLNIKGPQTVASGNETEFRVVYTNGENSDMSAITLEVFYPANFKFVSASENPTTSTGQRFDLPVLRQGQTGELVIKGKLSGATGEVKELRAKLNYTLSNFSSNFFTEASFTTTLTSPELEMSITGPIDVTNGQNSTFTVNYKNVSGKDFEATAVELKYPEGFKFASAVPAPSKNENYWSLGKLASGAEGKIEITGSFIGDPGSEQQVSGDLGLVLPGGLAPQIHSSARFKLQSSSLNVTISSNPESVVDLGQSIQYSVKYANYGSVGQNNVVVTTTLEGAALDMAKLKASNGIVTGNTITWKSATVPGLSLLSPNQSGEVSFNVPLRPNITTNLKNQKIKASTTIYSDSVSSPIRGQDLELKLASKLEMIVSGQYVSGAMPMKVGQSTTFNITVIVTNLSNDLADTTLLASMPLPASSWVNVVTPDAEKSNVTFDRNASKIRWKLGTLPAFVGKYSPARTMNFQLQVTPSESDRGHTMTLLKDISLSGTDTFINKEISTTTLNQFTVADLNDDTVDSRGTSVE